MITINGWILENRYTTSQWAAITAILPDRVWGHEIDSSGNPIGSKLGDGIHLWADLPYWYGGNNRPNTVKSFTAATGLTINWQTESPDGYSKTYLQLYGNKVQGFVYGTLNALGQPLSWTLDGSNNVDVVTFDWGSVDTGYISFS